MLPTIIVDNFFDDVEKIIKLSKTLEYYPRNKNENWPGLRTKSLHLTNYGLFNDIVLKILNYYYPSSQLKYSDAYVGFSKLKYGDKGKTRFHYDDDTKVAAVIYLSNGDMKSGTTLFHTEKEKQIVVANKFNTMVAYDGKKYHGFTSLKTVKKERLTLNIFVKSIEIIR
tara:strand:+ start:62 stop:568 length:507 start_codon:yes stop_codon:yes gene_type:complete